MQTADYTQRQAQRAAEQALDATRVIRDGIRKLPGIGERDIAAILACLSDVMMNSGWSHTSAASEASELLDSAHDTLLAQAEKHE